MSEDIVTRLRAWVPCYRSDTDIALDLTDAADEIERLRAELRTYTGDGHNTKGEPCTPNTPS